MTLDQGTQTVRCGDCQYLEPSTPMPGEPLGSGFRCLSNENRLIGHVYDIKPLWCPKESVGGTPAVQENDQGGQPRADGPVSRRLSPAVRYVLVLLLPLILALSALVAKMIFD